MDSCERVRDNIKQGRVRNDEKERANGAFMSPVYEIYYTALKWRTYIYYTIQRGEVRSKKKYDILLSSGASV